MIYTTCIIYVLIVVAIYQFTMGTNQGHISNFIFSLHEPSAPLPKGATSSNQQSIDLSIVLE
jgi:hypothetical protein